MHLSRILQEERKSRQLEEQLRKNIQNTSTLVKAILPQDILNENQERIEGALQQYEEQGQKKEREKEKKINFKYPEKTTNEAELEYHKRVQEEETTYRKEYDVWNRKIYQAYQDEGSRRTREPAPGAEGGHIQPNEADTVRIESQVKIRIAENKQIVNNEHVTFYITFTLYYAM